MKSINQSTVAATSIAWQAVGCLLVALFASSPGKEVDAAEGRTVTAGTSEQLREALASAKPGTTIRLLPGEYSVGDRSFHLRGEPGLPIVVEAALPQYPAVITGDFQEGLQLVSPEHVVLRHLVFEGARSISLHVDDGDPDRKPGRDLRLEDLVIRPKSDRGRVDGIKFSGVEDFSVERCVVDGWGDEGQALNLIGCRNGRIVDCSFEGHGTEKVGVQIKGGSRDILVHRCTFRGIKDRSLLLGGVTGLEFFRPHPERFELKDARVTECTFARSTTPIAFVSIDGAVVERNVVYRPTGWVFRILQENKYQGFIPCRGGIVRDNVVVWRQREVFGIVDARSDTSPETFRFEGNIWYCQDAPFWSRPHGLPTVEQGGVYGEDPHLRNPDDGDLTLGRSHKSLRDAFTRDVRTFRSIVRNSGSIALGVVIVAVTGLSLWSRRFGFATRSKVDVRYRWPCTPIRSDFAILFGVWAAVFIIGSLHGFSAREWNPSMVFGKLTQPSGDDPHRRAEWITELLMFIPLGVLGGAVLTLDRPDLSVAVMSGFAVVGITFFGLCIEILQSCVPGAVVSQNDAAAGLLGCAIGIGIWREWGEALVERVRWVTRNWRPRQPVDVLLGVYATGLLACHLWPCEFVLYPLHLYYRSASGALGATPMTVQSFVLHAALFAPLGALVVTAGTGVDRPVRSWWRGLTIGVPILAVLELSKFFVRSRVVDTTHLLTGTVGIAVGMVLMRWWAFYSPLFSPLPTTSRALNSARWVASGTLSLVLIGGLVVAFSCVAPNSSMFWES